MSARSEKGKSLIQFLDEYVVIDIETTGLDFSCDIIEISALKISNGEIIGEYSSLVKPAPFFIEDDDFQIPHYVDEFITYLTGITDSMLHDANSLPTVISEFSDFIGNSILVGHNIAAFDLNFLYDALMNTHSKALSNDFVDTLRLSRIALPALKHHRLSDIAEHYHIDHEKMHRGIIDCKIAYECYNHLKDELIEQFGSLEHFYAEQKKKRYDSHTTAKEITTCNTDFDTTNPIYNSVCVFTGTLEKMTRKEAMQIVVDLGGKVSDNITKKTNYLILGNNDFCKTIKDGKSTKQKKAEQMILDGCDISVISENVFYEIVGSN